jgi:hypothetical protein
VASLHPTCPAVATCPRCDLLAAGLGATGSGERYGTKIAPRYREGYKVYGIALFAVLEARGFDVKRVDPHAVRQVPGRKTDGKDGQWLQELHTYG